MLDEKIIEILKSKPDIYVSGEELCKLADISRSAIWKHIEKLREQGYDIEAVPHFGYKLAATPDVLMPAEVKWHLKAKVIGKEVISYRKIDSTNDTAYALAEKGMKEGTVILAEEQSKGKGRHGRAWVSPPKGGVYMSIILRPSIAPNEIPKITLLAAVAVAQAVRDLCGLEVMIKWPNDILMDGRKLCGILTEMKAEQDRVNFVVVGIGINVTTPIKSLPKGASSIKEELARSGKSDAISRVEIARNILEQFEKYYMILGKGGFVPIIEAWKSLSSMLGSRVRVVLQNRTFEGNAHTVDPDGCLVVRLDSGVLEKVPSGDIVVVR